MYTERRNAVVTQLTRAHIGYIGSVVPLPSRPAALGPKSLLSQYIPCGTRACYYLYHGYQGCIGFVLQGQFYMYSPGQCGSSAGHKGHVPSPFMAHKVGVA